MIGNADSALRIFHVSFLVGCVCVASAGAVESPSAAKANGGVHVQLQDAAGESVAHTDASPGRSKFAILTVERVYQPGDRIVFGGVPWMALRVDDSIPECFIFAPRAASE